MARFILVKDIDGCELINKDLIVSVWIENDWEDRKPRDVIFRLQTNYAHEGEYPVMDIRFKVKDEIKDEEKFLAILRYYLNKDLDVDLNKIYEEHLS